jgi:hypothetical protein
MHYLYETISPILILLLTLTRKELSMGLLLITRISGKALYQPRIVGRRPELCTWSQSNTSSCGKVCIQGFQEPNCQGVRAPLIAKVRDTTPNNGRITPLEWWDYSRVGETLAVNIKSVRYLSPTTMNTTSRNPILFFFYGPEDIEDELENGVMEVTPGQNDQECVDF